MDIRQMTVPQLRELAGQLANSQVAGKHSKELVRLSSARSFTRSDKEFLSRLANSRRIA